MFGSTEMIYNLGCILCKLHAGDTPSSSRWLRIDTPRFCMEFFDKVCQVLLSLSISTPKIV